VRGIGAGGAASGMESLTCTHVLTVKHLFDISR
jgi:hypothetical protein